MKFHLLIITFSIFLILGCINQISENTSENILILEQSIESNVSLALPLIYTNYSISNITENDCLRFQKDTDNGILYLAKAKKGIFEIEKISKDTYYINGWKVAIMALESEAEGTRVASELNIRAIRTQGTIDEEQLNTTVKLIHVRNLAIENYEELISKYPEQAEKVNAVYRLSILRERVNYTKNRLKQEIDEYQTQQIISSLFKLWICSEIGGLGGFC